MHELAISGRFDEAVEWADRAVARCLQRTDQVSARSLSIEAKGILALAQLDQRSAQLYVAGAHEPARRALETIPPEERTDYALLFLLGRCQLAAGDPDEAQATFGRAAEVCDRLAHRAVLRSLAKDVDSAYLALARQRINAALEEDPAEAITLAAAVFARLQDPAAWLVDFGRLFYTAAVECPASGQRQLALPPIAVAVPWEPELHAALATADDVDRALAVAELAERVHPAARTQARALADRARALKVRLETRVVLTRTGELMQARRFEDALRAIEEAPPAVASEPRLMRLRILSLLGLHRFPEAEAAAELAAGTASAELKGFLIELPTHVFRQRMAVVHAALRAGQLDGIDEVLAGAVPVTAQDQSELAYVRSFRLTIEGYRLRKVGKESDARKRLLEALRQIDGHLDAAQAASQRHIVELYDRLEKETESYA